MDGAGVYGIRKLSDKGDLMSNSTKIPNHVLDNMSELKPAAFKLAMALYRMTVGFHRNSVEISLSKLEVMTGLSRQGIVNAAEQISHLFTRAINGKSTVWVVNSVDQTSQLSRPDQSTELTNTSQLSSTITSGLKKKERNIKETTKKSGDSGNFAAVVRAYENNINANPGQTIYEELGYAVDEFTAEWVQDAIAEAAKNGVYRWNYIHKILSNWKEKGRKNTGPKQKQIVQTADGGFYV